MGSGGSSATDFHTNRSIRVFFSDMNVYRQGGSDQLLTETKCRDKFSPHQGTAIQAPEQIRSISYLKSHVAQISEEVAAIGAPVIITQNGEAAMVIEGVQQYQDKQELIALLKLLALGEKDLQAGLGLSVEGSYKQFVQRRQPCRKSAWASSSCWTRRPICWTYAGTNVDHAQVPKQTVGMVE